MKGLLGVSGIFLTFLLTSFGSQSKENEHVYLVPLATKKKDRRPNAGKS